MSRKSENGKEPNFSNPIPNQIDTTRQPDENVGAAFYFMHRQSSLWEYITKHNFCPQHVGRLTMVFFPEA